jgi:hypothetical protein
MRKSHIIWIWITLALLLLTACAVNDSQEKSAVGNTPPQRENIPVESSDPIPGWYQLLPFDGINPIYNPQFISREEANLQDGELIMGVAWEGVAKAYPVTVLRHREMVNDEMAGVPYLVSW